MTHPFVRFASHTSLALTALGLFTLPLSGCPGSHGAGAIDAGPDATPIDAGPDATPIEVDAAPREDAGPATRSCEPMQAALDPCGPFCDEITGFIWDGSRCVQHSCDCVGDECEVYETRGACEAAHATCDATLCLGTGGSWFNVPRYCGHFECGRPPEEICEVPTRVCDCGAFRVFQEGVGCVDGALCELPEPVEPSTLCEATGGDWREDICGSAVCGRLSDADCLEPGCVCDADEVFDTTRGCVPSGECEVRWLGEDCTASQLCGAGAVCCTNGIGTATCEAPMCGSPDGVCGPPRP